MDCVVCPGERDQTLSLPTRKVMPALADYIKRGLGVASFDMVERSVGAGARTVPYERILQLDIGMLAKREESSHLF